jgi:hypothetical protein
MKAMDRLPENAPPQWMVDLLERSEAHIAAGDIVPIDPVLDRVRASIDRMRARKTEAQRTPKA